MKRFESKVAIVTASSEGIGLSIAHRLAKEGAHVVISSRKKANVETAVKKLQAEGLTVTGVVCHVSKAEDRKNLITIASKINGKIDILISNAAVQPLAGPSLDAPDEVWDKIFEVNVKAAWQLVKDTVNYMPKGSSILFVSSTAAYDPSAPLGLYGLSKTTLLGLTRLLARELGPKEIRVNGLAPGIIKTKFSAMLWQTKEAESYGKSRAFLGRIGESDEMGGVAAFLVSDDASFVTGETVVAGGGTVSHL